jgi:hypothetical protein
LLDQKVTKNQVSRNASLPHMAFALQSGKTTGCKMLPHFVRSTLTLQQLLLCPYHAQAIIVLPDFARSCSADGGKQIINYVIAIRQSAEKQSHTIQGGHAEFAIASCPGNDMVIRDVTRSCSSEVTRPCGDEQNRVYRLAPPILKTLRFIFLIYPANHRIIIDHFL